MPYLLNAGKFLLETLFGFFIVLFLVRAMLIVVGASFYEPICQFVYRITNPVITPLRRFVPRWRNLEIASLLVAWLLATLETSLLLALFGLPFWFFGLLPYGFVEMLDWIILIELAAIIVYCVMSFVPAMRYDSNFRLVDRFVAPVVGPFRRIMPPLGGLDFSAWFASIALILVRILIIGPLADFTQSLR
jgi:YggT family protein